jgi:uncharacterized protein
MDEVAREFADQLRAELGPRVAEIRLFGSRARGDARQNSDYDILVILDRRTPEIRSEVLKIAVRLMDKYNVLVVTVLRSAEEWRKAQGYPLALNIARESVLL